MYCCNDMKGELLGECVLERRTVTSRVLVVGVGGDGPAGLSASTISAHRSWLISSGAASDCWRSGRIIRRRRCSSAPESIHWSVDWHSVVRTKSSSWRPAIPAFTALPGRWHDTSRRRSWRIIPHVSSLQLAFARAGVPWSDAAFTSAHARPLAEVIGWAKRARKLGILTDGTHSPAFIARAAARRRPG